MKEEDITPLVVVSVPFLGGLMALGMIFFLMNRLSSAPAGKGFQLEISEKISAGAVKFLQTEYYYLVPFVVVMGAFIIGVLEGQEDPPKGESVKGGWQTCVCFVFGAILSASAGWGGMKIATAANVKTMEAAKTGLNPALQIAFSGGAVMGFTVVASGLLGVVVLFFAFSMAKDGADKVENFERYMQESVRFLSGFGASSIALFARVAGGIYTKAADVGADLVGKVEANIPEDDPRNPATIADNVGDNVGDVAGMGADLFESFVGSIIASAALASNNREMALPFWIAGFGILAAVIGFFVVRTKDDATQSQLLHTLHNGTYVASLLVVGLSALSVYILFGDGSDDNMRDFEMQKALFAQGSDCSDLVGLCATKNRGWKLFACILIGLVSGILIGSATEYFTSYAYKPTMSITEAGSMGGAATVVIQGLGVGMFSCVPPVIVIVLAIISCYSLASVYGISIAAVGMLSTLGVTLATDAYGPIADNAGGIAEMSPDCDEKVRERTDALDALGNTTAATGKGFAIGSAVLTALAFMSAYSENVDVKSTTGKAQLDLTDPLVLSGVMIGSMLPYLFGALTMLSVRKAAGSIIVEVQRQFREIKGLLEGEPGVTCDSDACISLCTQASVEEMVLPGALAVLSPITIGLLVGAKCLGGLLAGSIASGFMLAVMMSNAGGAWDNAKKYIENEKVFGGKGSDTHKACVVGDTIGDPFKDTSGPALNILIKLMSILSLTLAPLFTEDWDTWWAGLILLGVMGIVCGVAFYAFWVKKKTI
ncbi:putative K(+)-stimulated pyrophosphate-energized sodium pump [Chloropicon roscoffensis]|uniref:H(+)-exporting diphosphatase n=1 Tax=Chloropicon roscoffensis TaxID=1461544 RepID=A0AAX4P3Y0_9CHLO